MATGSRAGWYVASDGLTVRRNSANAELVRSSLAHWASSLRHFDEFGTLTLRTIHGKGCPCGPAHSVRHEGHCTGTDVRREADCGVPDVRTSGQLVEAFLSLCDAAIVAEEFGAARGRRHFHFVAIGAEKARKTECFQCLAGVRTHRTHSGIEFWTEYGGHVDNTRLESPTKAIRYVTKAVGYTVKDFEVSEIGPNEWRTAPDGRHVNDASTANDGNGRFWVKA